MTFVSDPQWKNRHSWATLQAERAGLSGEELDAFSQLIETWWALDLPKDAWETFLSVFVSSAKGHAFEQATSAQTDKEVWEPVKPGRIVVRDYVRVRANAYSGQEGNYHNGRSGPVVAIRNGDVHVMYDDGGPRPSMGVRHSPSALEKRINVKGKGA